MRWGGEHRCDCAALPGELGRPLAIVELADQGETQ